MDELPNPHAFPNMYYCMRLCMYLYYRKLNLQYDLFYDMIQTNYMDDTEW